MQLVQYRINWRYSVAFHCLISNNVFAFWQPHKWIYTEMNFFSPFRIVEQLALAMIIFTVLNIFFTIQDCWATCACPEKQSVPWIHCIEYIFFIVQDFWATCACPEIFHCIEIFFSFRIFERLSLTLKFFKQGAVALPPCTPVPENICSSKGNSFVFLKPATMLNGVG